MQNHQHTILCKPHLCPVWCALRPEGAERSDELRSGPHRRGLLCLQRYCCLAPLEGLQRNFCRFRAADLGLLFNIALQRFTRHVVSSMGKQKGTGESEVDAQCRFTASQALTRLMFRLSAASNAAETELLSGAAVPPLGCWLGIWLLLDKVAASTKCWSRA